MRLNRNNVVNITLLSLAFLEVIFILFLLIFKVTFHLNSDSASDLLYAKQIVLQHKFIPNKWFQTTEVFVFGNFTVIAFFLLFINNLVYAKILASILQLLIYISSIIVLSNSLKFSKRQTLIALLILLAPFNGSEYFEHVIIYNSYTLFISFIFVSIAVIIQYHQNKWFWIFLLIFSFIYGLQSVRLLANFLLPAIISLLLYGVFYKFEYKRIVLLAFCTISSLFGLIIFKLIYLRSSNYINSDYSSRVWSDSIAERWRPLVSIVLDSFSILPHGNILSAHSMLYIISLICFLSLLIVMVRQMSSKSNQLEHNLFKFIFICALFMKSYLLLFSNIDIIGRYFLHVTALSVFIVVISLSTIKNHKLYGLIIILIILSLINSYVNIRHYLLNDIYNNRSRVLLANKLSEMGYKCGYATYWNANITSILSHDVLSVAPLTNISGPGGDLITQGNNVSLGRFFWSVSEDIFNCKSSKKFIILTSKENDVVNHQLTSKGTQIIQDENFVVYSFESDPFTNIKIDGNSSMH
jgi:hypothetical protein